MNDIIIHDNLMTEEEINFVNTNIVMSDYFPVYFGDSVTSNNDIDHNHFFIFYHTLIKRNSSEINSNYYHFFVKILERFAEKHNIKINSIIRGCVNISVENSKYKFVEPHVDNTYPHKVFILYLNDLNEKGNYSKTIIFDKKFDIENFEYTDKNDNTIVILKEKDILEKIKIKKSISPKIGRALCFDGKYYHSASFPSAGKTRYVLVFNFT